MKTIVVVESLSYCKTNVLFQRILQDFKMSKFATGSALYQIQNGKPILIAYTSKRLPEAARNYSITELEMCRLAIYIVNFTHLLMSGDFNAIVDHLALIHIIKSKVEPA